MHEPITWLTFFYWTMAMVPPTMLMRSEDGMTRFVGAVAVIVAWLYVLFGQ